MTGQLSVPGRDGPIPLPRDVLTCRVGTLFLKAQTGQLGLLPRCPWAQWLCRRSIDPPAVTEPPRRVFLGPLRRPWLSYPLASV